ncbi:ATP-binding protein [Burkholderia gladioli]|uniref:ATP-binding protein n=1 Tax=Burkholderia gladioli TaxID=28095 RepID=UPI0016415306|nr:ATP-binding protein [Burkholderia gladioli]
MYIETISVRGLHKAIDADLTLQPDVGIIVGINGAGKTSIINLTAHLLRLNVPELLRINFEQIEITGQDKDNKKLAVRATKENGELTITAKRSGRKVGEFACPTPPASAVVERPEERAAIDRYLRRTTLEIGNTELAAFIRDNVRLTLVKLDRTLFAEDYTGAVAIDPVINPRVLRKVAEELDPITQVERATRERYTEYQNQLKRLNEELTNKLVLQLFRETDIFARKGSDAPAITDKKQISKLEDSIRKSSFYPKAESDQQAISEYFKFTKALSQEFSRTGSSRRTTSSDVWQKRFFASALERFERLNMLAKEFNTFDSRANEAYKDVGAYLIAINSFLAESSKEAFFSEIDNTLRFKIIGETESHGRPISELSSGEKQIVTVLAYLAYLAGENSIFLIDEPELSLHISWQTGLLAALKAVQPKGCQLIMATHSPEIVSEQREKVVRLIPKYRVGK